MSTSRPVMAPEETITRMQMMQHGSTILTALAIGTGAALLILAASSSRLPLLYGGLHLVNFGGTMAVAAGALSGHRAMIGHESRTQQMLAKYDKRIEDRLRRLEEVEHRILDVENRILAAAADDGDDLSHRRNRHHN